MKYVSLFLTGLIAFLVLSSEQVYKEKFAPPGTIYLRQNLYIDQRPTENVNYLEYEYWMRKVLRFNIDCIHQIVDTLPLYGVVKDSLAFPQLCPASSEDDSLIINSDLPISWATDGMNYYLRSPATQHYPLINVTHKMAQTYCEWRTYVVMSLYATIAKEKERKKYFKRLKYRLPTQQEWELAQRTFQKDTYMPTVKSNSSLLAQPFAIPNEKAKYFMSNISEMVEEYGVAKGWNFKHKSSFNQPNYSTTYQYPEDWLGFRCVCEVEDWDEGK